MLLLLILLVNFAILLIEIYREVKVFHRDLRMRTTRENFERRRLMQMQMQNHNNHNDREDED